MDIAGAMATQGAQDMERIKEQNTYMRYFWLENKRGRKVPVAEVFVRDALKNGFTHTDKILHIDNPEDNVREGLEIVSENPVDKMAAAVEKLADIQAINMGMVDEDGNVLPKKKAGRPAKNTVAKDDTIQA